MLFQLFNEPARIINPDIELIVCRAQERARQVAQFGCGGTSQFGKVPAAPLVDQAFLEINSDLRIGALEKALDLAEEGFVQSKTEA